MQHNLLLSTFLFIISKFSLHRKIGASLALKNEKVKGYSVKQSKFITFYSNCPEMISTFDELPFAHSLKVASL